MRCTHKENPFNYNKGYTNQIGNFDYVDKVSDIIINLIEGNANGVYNIGTELNITDVTSTDTNYLFIELAQASGEEVYGGYVTIEAV